MAERLLAQLNRDWQVFLDSLACLPDSALLQPGVVGEWSLRDIMGHVTTWEEESIKALPAILARVPPPTYGGYGGVGVDAFNAQKAAEKHALTLADIRRDLAATHQILLGRIAAIPDEAVDAELERRVAEDTWNHYRQHAEQIRAWRGRQT